MAQKYYGGRRLKRKKSATSLAFPHASGAALKKSTTGMKNLIRLASQNPELVWSMFQRWFRRASRNDMPLWIIERFDGDEVHVHLWDYALEAIEGSMRKWCALKKLEVSEEFPDDPLPQKHLCISKNGRPLMTLHTTSCSMPGDSFICVHLRPDDAPLRLLLVKFCISIYPEDLAFYRKLYRQPRATARPTT